MILIPLRQRLERAYQAALSALLAERNPEGYWTGELSTSALSTATAVSALALVQKHAPAVNAHDRLIAGGLAWLAAHQNADGGWGDTVKSISNISTTMLCRAAFHLGGASQQYPESLKRACAYLEKRYGKTPQEHAEAVRARYGKDRTFAVPILTTCALAELTSWREVQALPFELACFPQSWFRFFRLPVVSYALPALIAIGQAVYYHRRPWNPVTRLTRWLSRRRSLRVLQAIQPSSGGFLEATPLTSFVTLSLASIGQADHPVARKGVEFLVKSALPDGSWPIDTNLATWVTTLAVNALAASGELGSLDKQKEFCQWLKDQHYMERHPYTGADPGGWAWTPLPGGVPDGDDTPGALLALSQLAPSCGPSGGGISSFVRRVVGKARVLEIERSSLVHIEHSRACDDDAFHFLSGLAWLLGLQNRNGGWPTFCQGWGNLPFDRSGTDLTAHALRAISVCQGEIATGWFARAFSDVFGVKYHLGGASFRLPSPQAIEKAIMSGLSFLARTQRADGSWLPLWFGNQHAPNDENPTYGTARVLAAYRDLDMMNTEPARRGIAWLLSVQNGDGGWGGAGGVSSSMEETALAVDILLDGGTNAEGAVNKGLAWLVDQVETGGLKNPTPIGFYFAKLWYFERLYPIIFTVAALGRARKKFTRRPDQAHPNCTTS